MATAFRQLLVDAFPKKVSYLGAILGLWGQASAMQSVAPSFRQCKLVSPSIADRARQPVPLFLTRGFCVPPIARQRHPFAPKKHLVAILGLNSRPVHPSHYPLALKDVPL